LGDFEQVGLITSFSWKKTNARPLIIKMRITKPAITRLRLKQCRRCNKMYKGTKYSKYCTKCYLEKGWIRLRELNITSNPAYKN
jgi:hypothetical protein